MKKEINTDKSDFHKNEILGSNSLKSFKFESKTNLGDTVSKALFYSVSPATLLKQSLCYRCFPVTLQNF